MNSLWIYKLFCELSHLQNVCIFIWKVQFPPLSSIVPCKFPAELYSPLYEHLTAQFTDLSICSFSSKKKKEKGNYMDFL